MKLSVFYSWQSDLPNSTNRTFVERALKSALGSLQAQLEATLVPCLDRDTQNVPGTPDIVSTIFRKIEESHVVVSDISIVNRDAAPERRTPNPNVLLELGYAVKHLGWDKIICVYNLAYGEAADLPFDLRTRRVLTYRAADDEPEKGRQRDLLARKLADAVRMVIEHERQLKEIRKDVAQVTLDVAQTRHLPTLEFGRDEREKIRAEVSRGPVQVEAIARLLAAGKLPPKKLFDEFQFLLAIRNIGERTIGNLVLEITTRCSEGFWLGPEHANQYVPADGGTHQFRLSTNVDRPLLPDERIEFPATWWTIKAPEGNSIEEGHLRLYWKALLDNAGPSLGTLDIGEALRAQITDVSPPKAGDGG